MPHKESDSDCELLLPSDEELDREEEKMKKRRVKEDSKSSSDEEEEKVSSSPRKARTSDMLDLPVTAAESKFRSKHFSGSKILDQNLNCTSCNKNLKSFVAEGREVFHHPVLRVLVCKECCVFYGDGNFSTDEDGSDKYCRWCGQGGNLYCCSTCSCAFCKPCMKRNFHRSIFDDVEKDDWKCFVCNPKPLWDLRAVCSFAQDYTNKTKRKKTRQNKDRLLELASRSEEKKNSRTARLKQRKSAIRSSTELSESDSRGSKQKEARDGSADDRDKAETSKRRSRKDDSSNSEFKGKSTQAKNQKHAQKSQDSDSEEEEPVSKDRRSLKKQVDSEEEEPVSKNRRSAKKQVDSEEEEPVSKNRRSAKKQLYFDSKRKSRSVVEDEVSGSDNEEEIPKTKVGRRKKKGEDSSSSSEEVTSKRKDSKTKKYPKSDSDDEESSKRKGKKSSKKVCVSDSELDEKSTKGKSKKHTEKPAGKDDISDSEAEERDVERKSKKHRESYSENKSLKRKDKKSAKQDSASESETEKVSSKKKHSKKPIDSDPDKEEPLRKKSPKKGVSSNSEEKHGDKASKLASQKDNDVSSKRRRSDSDSGPVKKPRKVSTNKATDIDAAKKKKKVVITELEVDERTAKKACLWLQGALEDISKVAELTCSRSANLIAERVNIENTTKVKTVAKIVESIQLLVTLTAENLNLASQTLALSHKRWLERIAAKLAGAESTETDNTEADDSKKNKTSLSKTISGCKDKSEENNIGKTELITENECDIGSAETLLIENKVTESAFAGLKIKSVSTINKEIAELVVSSNIVPEHDDDDDVILVDSDETTEAKKSSEVSRKGLNEAVPKTREKKLEQSRSDGEEVEVLDLESEEGKTKDCKARQLKDKKLPESSIKEGNSIQNGPAKEGCEEMEVEEVDLGTENQKDSDSVQKKDTNKDIPENDGRVVNGEDGVLNDPCKDNTVLGESIAASGPGCEENEKQSGKGEEVNVMPEIQDDSIVELEETETEKSVDKSGKELEKSITEENQDDSIVELGGTEAEKSEENLKINNSVDDIFSDSSIVESMDAAIKNADSEKEKCLDKSASEQSEKRKSIQKQNSCENGETTVNKNEDESVRRSTRLTKFTDDALEAKKALIEDSDEDDEDKCSGRKKRKRRRRGQQQERKTNKRSKGTRTTTNKDSDDNNSWDSDVSDDSESSEDNRPESKKKCTEKEVEMSDLVEKMDVENIPDSEKPDSNETENAKSDSPQISEEKNKESACKDKSEGDSNAGDQADEDKVTGDEGIHDKSQEGKNSGSESDAETDPKNMKDAKKNDDNESEAKVSKEDKVAADQNSDSEGDTDAKLKRKPKSKKNAEVEGDSEKSEEKSEPKADTEMNAKKGVENESDVQNIQEELEGDSEKSEEKSEPETDPKTNDKKDVENESDVQNIQEDTSCSEKNSDGKGDAAGNCDRGGNADGSHDQGDAEKRSSDEDNDAKKSDDEDDAAKMSSGKGEAAEKSKGEGDAVKSNGEPNVDRNSDDDSDTNQRKKSERAELNSLLNLKNLKRPKKKISKDSADSSEDEQSEDSQAKQATSTPKKTKKQKKDGTTLKDFVDLSDSDKSPASLNEEDDGKLDDIEASFMELGSHLKERWMIAKKELLESSSSDLDSSDEDDKAQPKKKKKTKSKEDASSNEDKKKNIKKEEEDSEEEDEDSDDVGKKKKKWRTNKLLRGKLVDTSSSEEERRWKAKKERELKEEQKSSKKKSPRIAGSDSDSDVTSLDSSDDDDSDFVGKRSSKRKAARSSSSGEKSSDTDKKKKTKPKRRRIKRIAHSDSDSSSGDQLNTSKGDTPGKGRKNIRAVLEDDSVEEATRKATREEQERRKRIAEKQEMYNKLYNELQDGVEKVEKLVLDFDPETKEELVKVDEKLVAKMKPHQAKGVKFMWDACFETIKDSKKSKGSGCILAHCMGLGKTFQVVSLIHTLMTYPETKMKTVLIVCPLSTVLNWCNEFNMWLKETNHEDELEVYELTRYKLNYERAHQLKDWHNSGGVMVIGYDMFRNLVNTTSKRARKNAIEAFQTTLLDPGPDLVVCDEGHLLKNEDTALSKAMRRIRTLRRIVLTGTPLQNNLKEYHCMVQFVKPNLLGTRKEFLNRFVNPITNGQFEDSTSHDVKIMKRRAHVLHKMLEGCVQRFDYSVLMPFLPPKHEYVICIRLTELQSKLYQHYLINCARGAMGEGGKGARLFADYQALQRVWTHPRVLRMNADKMERIAEKKELEASESEGSLKDFLDDSTTEPSSSEEESTSSSDDDSSGSDKKEKKKKKPDKVLKKRSTRSSRRQAEKNGDKDEDEGKAEDEDIVVLDEAAPKSQQWWESFIQGDEMEDMRESSKLMLLFSILRDSEKIGDKVLVFSQSLYSLDLIEYFLERIDEATQNNEVQEKLGNHLGSWSCGLDYFRLDGSTSSENRNIWCKAFNREDNLRARLFLISTRAGGLGINLFAANRVIIFDASWNPSHDVQSIFRVYRFGQKKPCYIYRFLASGTMEEKIYDRQVAKLSLACRVVDEHQIERHFNFADLNELYTFDPELKTKRPTPILPKDRLLAELLKEHESAIETYHEHDSLLENKQDEGLNEEERKAAWEEYENEKKGVVLMPNPLLPNAGQAGAAAGAMFNPYGQLNPGMIRNTLRAQNPHFTEEQLTQQFNQIIRQIYDYTSTLNGQVMNTMGMNSMGMPVPQMQPQMQPQVRPQMNYRSAQPARPQQLQFRSTLQPANMSDYMLQQQIRHQQLRDQQLRDQQQYKRYPQVDPKVNFPQPAHSSSVGQPKPTHLARALATDQMQRTKKPNPLHNKPKKPVLVDTIDVE